MLDTVCVSVIKVLSVGSGYKDRIFVRVMKFASVCRVTKIKLSLCRRFKLCGLLER